MKPTVLFAQAPESNHHIAMRYLGEFSEEKHEGYVILEDNLTQSNFIVTICAPKSSLVQRESSEKNSLEVLLLDANAVPLSCQGGGIINLESNKAVFFFKKIQPVQKLREVIVRCGETTNSFVIPPSSPTLSEHSQFCYDQLTSYSAELLEKYESGHLSGEKPQEQEIKNAIKELKRLLYNDGINIVWDYDKRAYRIQ